MTIVKTEWRRSTLEFVELEQYDEIESIACPLDRHLMIKEALVKMSEISRPFVDYIVNGDGLPDEIIKMAEKSRRIRAGTRIKKARLLFSEFMFESHYGIDLDEFKAILDEYVT